MCSQAVRLPSCRLTSLIRSTSPAYRQTASYTEPLSQWSRGSKPSQRGMRMAISRTGNSLVTVERISVILSSVSVRQLTGITGTPYSPDNAAASACASSL